MGCTADPSTQIDLDAFKFAVVSDFNDVMVENRKQDIEIRTLKERLDKISKQCLPK